MNIQVQPAMASVTALPIFQAGDIVSIKGTKDVGRVIVKSCGDYTVCVYGEPNRDEDFAFDILEMWTPAPRRKFKSSEVRIVGTRFNGRIGYVIEDNGNEEEDRPYLVCLYGGDYAGSEERFSASELTPWVPLVGDWVTEWQSDGRELGKILANDGITSHVQWETLKDASYWPNIRLEPGNRMPG
jgi:hypothetical protein